MQARIVSSADCARAQEGPKCCMGIWWNPIPSIGISRVGFIVISVSIARYLQMDCLKIVGRKAGAYVALA